MQQATETALSSDTPQSTPAISGAVGCERAGKTVTGLVTFFFDFRNPAHEQDKGTVYTLSVNVPGEAAPVLEKPLRFTELILTPWVALNSHRLPNGPTAITFSLKHPNGNTLWQGSISINIANTGWLAEQVKESVRRFHTPVVVDGGCATTHYDYDDSSVRPWFDRDNAFDHIEQRLRKREISADDAAKLEQFVLDGFIVLPDLLSKTQLDRINAELDDAIAKKVEGYEYGSSQRIHQLHLQYAGIRELWRNPTVLRLLDLIFEAPARPCQSLTYVFGSQQYAHQDTVFLTPFPAGYMCGVWYSLEDIRPDSGELEVFRGSHRLPRVYMHDVGLPKIAECGWPRFEATVPPLWKKMIDAGKFERIVYRPKAGTALIWHENLMHGGSTRIDQSLSRRSIVTHNFADGAIAYYDSTGHVGHMEPLENLKA